MTSSGQPIKYPKGFAALAVLSALLLLAGCTQKAQLDRGTALSSIPALNEQAKRLDFAYPSRPPSLKEGKEVFTRNCSQCHAAGFAGEKSQRTFLYATPIDLYLMLTTGEPPVLSKETDVHKQIVVSNKLNHQFRDKLTRDQRWAAVFYARHLAGAGDIVHKAVKDDPNVAAVFGSNCAVCHGNRGHADGFLHSGHPSSHELEAGKVHGGLFEPAPARFTQYDRMFNRTDAQIFKYIAEGIYPSAMPAWLGNLDKEKGYKFDEELIWMLVKQIRMLSYKSDLPEGTAKPAGLVPSAALAPKLNLKIAPVASLRQNAYTGASKNKNAYLDALVPRHGEAKAVRTPEAPAEPATTGAAEEAHSEGETAQ